MYIAQAELLGVLVSYLTLPDEFLRGRSIVHFVDNTVALSAVVNGFAGQPDMATLVLATQEALIRLRCRVWFEWVPSAANISDWPSRPAKWHLVPASAAWLPAAFPAPATLGDVIAPSAPAEQPALSDSRWRRTAA